MKYRTYQATDLPSSKKHFASELPRTTHRRRKVRLALDTDSLRNLVSVEALIRGGLARLIASYIARNH
jgi:hypothetical protein